MWPVTKRLPRATLDAEPDSHHSYLPGREVEHGYSPILVNDLNSEPSLTVRGGRRSGCGSPRRSAAVPLVRCLAANADESVRKWAVAATWSNSGPPMLRIRRHDGTADAGPS